MGRFLRVLLACALVPAALGAPVALRTPAAGLIQDAALGAMIASSVAAAIPLAGAVPAGTAEAPWMRALVAGDHAGAARLLEAAVARAPRDANLLYYLGIARNALGQFARALPVLVRAKALA